MKYNSFFLAFYLLPMAFILIFLGFELNFIAFSIFSLFELGICIWLGYKIAQRGLFNTFYSFVLLFALLCTISNSLWVFYIDSPIKEISKMPFVYASSIIPAIFSNLISASILLLLYIQSKNAQFLIDSFIKALVFFSFLWAYNYEKIDLIINLDSIYYFLLIFNISVFSTIFLSFKLSSLNHSFKLLSLAIFIYSIYGILMQISHSENVWGISEQWWMRNEIFIFVFYVYLLLLGLSANVAQVLNFVLEKTSQARLNTRNKNFLFLLIPVFFAIVSGYINLLFFSLLLGLLLVHRILSYHILNIAQSEERLIKEQEMHKELQRQIEINKKRLESTNSNLKRISRFDSITGTLNRIYFIAQLREMLSSKPLGERINVYAIDFSSFKIINDTYGRHVGDSALKIMAEKLVFLAGGNAIVGRFDGDDMWVATKRSFLDNDLTELAKLMLKSIKEQILIEQRQIKLHAKIGIASTFISEIKADDLIIQAETALNEAKQSNKDYVYFDEELSKKTWENTKISILLDAANFDEEFELVYQPQFEIASKKIIGVEALLRWNNPLKGNIPPAVFIPVAEQGSIIISIGSWVLKRAISQISNLNQKLDLNLQISVNVSPRQIENLNFTQEVLECLNRSNLKAEELNLEITEMNWVKAEEAATSVMASLTHSKVFISLDDFGTGFSSLEYIKKFDINKIKIAKELVDDLAISKANERIVMAIISMAKNMGIKTIAEGVEKQEQLDILSSLGCDELQGFVWSRPISILKLEELLRTSNA